MKQDIKVLTTPEMAEVLRVTAQTLQKKLRGEYKDMPRFEMLSDKGFPSIRRFNSKAVINWLEKTFN